MRSSRQFSFLNGPRKLVFVCMYGSTITGLVGQPYPYCLLVAFCTFLWFFLCLFVLFWAFGVCKIFLQKPHLQFEVIRTILRQFFFFLQKDIAHTKTLTSKD